MPVLFLQMLFVFSQGNPLMKPAPSFHLSNICTKLVLSLLIQSCAHQWKRYQMMLDSQLYSKTCLAFWRVLWGVFTSLAVCCCSALCYWSKGDDWMLLPGYHSQIPSPCGTAGRPESQTKHSFLTLRYL